MATLDEVHGLLTDLNARLDAVDHGMTEEQVRSLTSDILTGMLNDPNSDVYRKLRFAGNSEPNIVGTKFQRWNYTTADVEMLYDVLSASRRNGLSSGPSDELTRTFNAVSDAYYVPDDEIRRIDRSAIDDLFPRVTKANRAQYDAALRAMDSAESGFGSQLVGAQYVGDLWEAARPESRVFSLLNTFEMTAPTAYLPVEVDVPEMLFVSESTASNSANYTTSKTGSQRVQVDAKKMVIHQMWSGEMEEDSIIPYIPFLRRQAQISIAHYSDSLVLNGDTTNAATGNINLDDADPADTKHYLAFDGLRHVGIVDNTANQDDVNAAIAAVDFLAAYERMKGATAHAPVHWGMPTNPSDVVHIMDSATYWKVAALADVIALDKFGPNATILTGQLGSIFNHPIIPSEALSKTEADGKVSTTGSNNTKGQIVTFNRRGFVVGWRRRVKLETERIPATDQTRLVYSLRLGFGRFTPTGAASGIEAADSMFNITV